MDAISTSECASDADIVQGIKVFETDFPHPICLYPRPLEQVRESLTDLTAEERRKVLSTNAARVYNIPLD